VTSVLPREFFDAPATEVAPRLLGQLIEHRTPQGMVRARLTEVEAYLGAADSASHSFRGRTPRNEVMFGPPGYVYVYFTYGMHFCMNLVCGPGATPTAVLLRAGEIVDGVELATARRGNASARDLARGPARLTVALDVGREENGVDACSVDSAVRVLAGATHRDLDVRTGPRVGIATAAAAPWRYWLDGEPTVSVYRRHVPKRSPA
jgi:DNA-3-methyladenine glycosylase